MMVGENANRLTVSEAKLHAVGLARKIGVIREEAERFCNGRGCGT